MADCETQKYQCGCGKSYTSYPAYSTHKRLKHDNQSIIGTQLPKQYAPKRGRPSFSLPNQPVTTQNTYSSLTTVQLTLLKMQQKYGKVLTQPDAQGAYQYLQQYQQCQKFVVCRTGEALTVAIKNFNQVIVNHTNQAIGASVSKFLIELTQFLLQNIQPSQVRLDWEDKNQSTKKIDPFLFNTFFTRKGQKQRATNLAKQASKPLKFILDILVCLSEYLSKMNLLECRLKIKQ